jgi:hypothetical protein
MTATLTQIVKQFRQDWTDHLEPSAILTACRDVAYRWRERTLNPVTTIQLFFVQILHGNTACTHLRHLTKLNVTASAYCQARMKLPLTVFEQLLRSVRHALHQEPLEEGRWLGHRTFWLDGSSFSMPDTPALQEHFGQPGKQLPGCGFPVAHLLALLHAGTGMVLQILAAPLRTHDLSEGHCQLNRIPLYSPSMAWHTHPLNTAPRETRALSSSPMDCSGSCHGHRRTTQPIQTPPLSR